LIEKTSLQEEQIEVDEGSNQVQQLLILANSRGIFSFFLYLCQLDNNNKIMINN